MNERFKQELHKFEQNGFLAYLPFDTFKSLRIGDIPVLFQAAYRGDTAAIEKFIGTYGIAPHYRMRNEDGFTPFMVAVAEKQQHVAELIMAHVVAYDGDRALSHLLGTENIHGETALALAAGNGDAPMALMLMQAGAKTENIPDPKGILQKCRGEIAALNVRSGIAAPVSPLQRIKLIQNKIK